MPTLSYTASALFIMVTILVSTVICEHAMLAPPDRPHAFRSPNELRQYLKALNDYYAIVGRPRFGKRNGHMYPESFSSEEYNLSGSRDDMPSFRWW